MSKKIKRDKEQKGKNAVLVIAVGKHPKMGPGERNYKKDKSMKKAFDIIKQKKSQAERKQAYEERKERREKRAQEMDAYNAGTASEEVKQKIEQSKANTESGVNQNLRFADKNKGGSKQKRMPKKEKKPFDTNAFDRWVQSNSLTDKDTDRISSDNAMELAHRTGIKISDIQNKTFDNYDIDALKQALQAMGKANYEKRQKARLDRQDRQTTGVGRNEQEDTTPQEEGVDYDDLDDEDFYDESRREGEGEEEGPNLGPKGSHLDALKRIAIARGVSVEQLYDRITSQVGGDEEELNARGDYNEGEDSQMRNAPSDFTTPYSTREGTGFKSGSMRNPGGRNDDASGERGSSFKPGQTVEDTMHGFKPPINYGLARVGDNPLEDEEVNMDEIQEMMNQKAEPMELAFRLLKNITKGEERQCHRCGSMKTPSGMCACDRR
jgi:hypothetical protein